jgi:hypothetical protein
MSYPNPAVVVIDGVVLTEQQSDVIRVAVTHMEMDLSEPEFRRDVGEELSSGYQFHLRAVLRIMLGLPHRRK